MVISIKPNIRSRVKALKSERSFSFGLLGSGCVFWISNRLLPDRLRYFKLKFQFLFFYMTQSVSFSFSTCRNTFFFFSFLPVPIVWPIGNIVFQHVISNIQNQQLSQLSDFSRQGLEFITIDGQDTKILKLFDIICR